MREFPTSLSSDAQVGVAAKPPADVPGRHAAGMYAVWAVIATLTHGAGAVVLPAGAGLILAVGATLTLGLFLALKRLPGTEQPADSTLVASHAFMGITWATLYSWFAAASAGGAVLGVGMYLSAVALALPGARLPVLGRLSVAAGAGSLATPVLHAGLAGGEAASVVPLMTAVLPSLVLIVLLTGLYVAARTLAGAREQLQARNAELQAGIERITRSAERDHLTNSYNRQSILEMVGREKARAERNGEALCVCLLDIDHFKDMNDRFGHQTGDRILAAFARRVRGALRTMDVLNSGGLPPPDAAEQPGVPGRSAFGRVGGEEFIVLLPDTSLRGALRCAERVRKAVVRRPFDGLHQVTVSIGIAEYRPGESVTNLIGRADKALYGAKHAGRNRVHCATEGGANAIVMPDLVKGTGP